MDKVIAFGWYGGKYSHLNWLLPLLPQTTHFCEPFGGSAAVLLNRKPAPVETYDDIDCDPPYVHSSRGDSKAYAYEMTDDDHRELAHVLHSVKGKVAISGYSGALMDELYSDWQPITESSKYCHSIKQPRTEVLWINYEVGETELWQVQQTFLEQPLAI